MGGSEKHKKSKRKSQSKKPDSSPRNNNDAPGTAASSPALVQTLSERSVQQGEARYYSGPGEWDQNPEVGQAPLLSLNTDTKDWKLYSEEQLEEFLLRKLEAIYRAVYARLVSYGHPPDVVLKAILTNGHGFGNLDVFTNILQNSLAYIRTGVAIDNRAFGKDQQIFGEMKMMVKNSLAVMIRMLHQVRPNLINGEAMWCLLMCNFHLGTASAVKLPFVTNKGGSHVGKNDSPLHDLSEAYEASGHHQLSGDEEVQEFSKNGPSEKLDVWTARNPYIGISFKLTPSLEANLKKNIGNFVVACRASGEMSQLQVQASKSSMASKKSTESYEWEDSCMVNLVLRYFSSLTLNEVSGSEPPDPKVEIISRLVHDIKEIKQKVKERKEWAQNKVVQAAKKLSHDLSELRTLRLEDEINAQRKHYDMELKEENRKKLMRLEDAIRKQRCQADLANTTVKGLEVQNAEIKAEVEASKLTASESDNVYIKAVRREKKCLKKILALEKENDKYQAELEEVKKKSLHLHQQMVDLKKAQEEIEEIWRQQIKARDLVLVQVQEELRFKGELESNIKRDQDAVHQKIQLESQCRKDNVQRLEQEISHLEMSLNSSIPHHQPHVFLPGELKLGRPDRDTSEIIPADMGELLDSSSEEVFFDRVCWTCMENEVSVVFLPCAHQVLCANCTEDHCKNVGTKCPCCQGPITKRIHVYGASS